jgi:F-type H+-transporting ATPase subunit b
VTPLFASESASGISSLGLNLQAFVFQLITFVIIMWLLNKFALRKIFATLDARRNALEASLHNAQKAKQELTAADEKAEEILQAARVKADDIATDAKKEAAQTVKEAELKAAQKAERLAAESQEQIKQDIAKARQALKIEAAELVASAAGTVLNEKLNDSKDAQLITRSLNEAAK